MCVFLHVCVTPCLSLHHGDVQGARRALRGLSVPRPHAPPQLPHLSYCQLHPPGGRLRRRGPRDILVLARSSPTPAPARISPCPPRPPCPSSCWDHHIHRRTDPHVTISAPTLPPHLPFTAATRARTFEGESGHGDTRPRLYPAEASRFTRSECWSHAALLDSSPCPSPYLPFALPLRTERKMLFP